MEGDTETNPCGFAASMRGEMNAGGDPREVTTAHGVRSSALPPEEEDDPSNRQCDGAGEEVFPRGAGEQS